MEEARTRRVQRWHIANEVLDASSRASRAGREEERGRFQLPRISPSLYSLCLLPWEALGVPGPLESVSLPAEECWN